MMTRTKKPARSKRPRPTRSVRIVEAPDANAPDVYTVSVTVAGETNTYDVCRGMVAIRYPVWLVKKTLGTLAATVAKEAYVVDISNDLGTSCTCPAGTHRGTCRHVDFVVALTAAGKLPALVTPEPKCETCGGAGGPRFGDLDSDGAFCRSCGS